MDYTFLWKVLLQQLHHSVTKGLSVILFCYCKEGITIRIESIKFYALFLSTRGNISNHLQWKGMITRIHHFGLYTAPFESSRKQTSGILELEYKSFVLTFDLSLSLAADAGNTIRNNGGIQFRISKKF